MKHAVRKLMVLVSMAVLAAPSFALAQANPIDDLLKLAMDAFNDFKYSRSDTLARQVLGMQSATSAQRQRAQMVIAASAYPEEASAQRRSVALATLKQLLRVNYEAKLPQELLWAGLDSLVEEARRTTFGLQVGGTATQSTVGLDGTAKLHVKANRIGFFRLTIVPRAGSGVAVVDSIVNTVEGDFEFRTMRDEKPIFSTGDYNVIITGFAPGASGDTVTVQFALKADAPGLSFVPVPTSLDSSGLLKERAGRFGAKAILPALLAGGMAFALSSQLRGEGDIASEVGADSKGVAVGGAIAVAAVMAGFADKGRPLPNNIAANRATGEAFQRTIADAIAENRRRVVEYKTTLTFDFEAR